MKQRPWRGFSPGGDPSGVQSGGSPLPVLGSPLARDSEEEEEEELPPDVDSSPVVPESDPEESDVEPDVQSLPPSCYPPPEPDVGGSQRLPGTSLQPDVSRCDLASDVAPKEEPPGHDLSSPKATSGAGDTEEIRSDSEEDPNLDLEATQDFLGAEEEGWDPEEPTQVFCPPWEEEKGKEEEEGKEKEEAKQHPPEPSPQILEVPLMTPRGEGRETTLQGEAPTPGGRERVGIRRSARLQARLQAPQQPTAAESGQAELLPPPEEPIRRRRGQRELRPSSRGQPIGGQAEESEPPVAGEGAGEEPHPSPKRPMRGQRAPATSCSTPYSLRRGRGQGEPPSTGEPEQELHSAAKRPTRRGGHTGEQPIRREPPQAQPQASSKRPIRRQRSQARLSPPRKQPVRRGHSQTAPTIAESGELRPPQPQPITRHRTREQPIATAPPQLQPLPALPIPADPPQATPHPSPHRPIRHSRAPQPDPAQQPITEEPAVTKGPKLRPRMGPVSAPPKVLFTGVVASPALQKALRSLGGTVATSVLACSHLVTDRVRRTFKFLCALARGIPIVTPQWLLQSAATGRLLSPGPFLVQDPQQEELFGFSLAQALRRAHCQPLLQGYEVHVTPSVLPEPEQMKVIVTCSGGTFLTTMPRSYAPRRFVISCAADWELWEAALGAKLPLVSAELLLTGLLRQQLRFQPYLLRPLPKTKTPLEPPS